ncbi:hypothetical protein H1R20_g1261, partial [Candolleomyces eurysporus]
MDFSSGTEHFNVHYVPSDEEIPAIRDAVCKGEEAVKKIEGQMEELRQELRALEERREAQLPNFPTARLLTVPPQSTPALTTVKLHCNITEFQQENPLNEHMVSRTNIFNVPTLRSLSIGARVMFHDLTRMPVVWSNLEHLVFDGYPTESPHSFDGAQALALFKECPNLVTCRLALQRDITIPIGLAPVPLQKLRELAFTPHTSHLPKGFARLLILPSLRKLEVITGYGECTPREYQESGLSEFFERFRPTLKDVTFCYKSMTQTGLQDCLRYLPNVTSLGLVSSDRVTIATNAGAANLNNDLFKHLSPEFDERGSPVTQLPPCPRIEVFRVGAPRGEVAEEALIDFIDARQRGG